MFLVEIAKGLFGSNVKSDTSFFAVVRSEIIDDGKVVGYEVALGSGETDTIQCNRFCNASVGDVVQCLRKSNGEVTVVARKDGDKLVEVLNQHFYHDESGAHVVDDQQNRVDITANGMEITKGGDPIASFGESTRIGRADSDHISITPDILGFYGSASTMEVSNGGMSLKYNGDEFFKAYGGNPNEPAYEQFLTSSQSTSRSATIELKKQYESIEFKPRILVVSLLPQVEWDGAEITLQQGDTKSFTGRLGYLEGTVSYIGNTFTFSMNGAGITLAVGKYYPPTDLLSLGNGKMVVDSNGNITAPNIKIMAIEDKTEEFIVPAPTPSYFNHAIDITKEGYTPIGVLYVRSATSNCVPYRWDIDGNTVHLGMSRVATISSGSFNVYYRVLYFKN